MEKVILQHHTGDPNFIGAWGLTSSSICSGLIDHFLSRMYRGTNRAWLDEDR